MNNDRRGGLDFTDALTLLFITLKLIGVINWSWWWVISPILIEAVVYLIIKSI